MGIGMITDSDGVLTAIEIDNGPKGIAQKLLAVQKEIKLIDKSGFNPFGGYQYVEESHVLQVLNPLFNQYGILRYVTVLESKIETIERGGAFYNEAFVRIELCLMDPETEAFLKCEMVGFSQDKNGDKASGKALTGATKYAYLKFFGIPSHDDPEREDIKSKGKGKERKEYDPKQNKMAHYDRLWGEIEKSGLKQPEVLKMAGLQSFKGLDEAGVQAIIDIIQGHIQRTLVTTQADKSLEFEKQEALAKLLNLQKTHQVTPEEFSAATGMGSIKEIKDNAEMLTQAFNDMGSWLAINRGITA